jgi:hypothetical protein
LSMPPAYVLSVVGTRSFLADIEVDASVDMGAIVRGEVACARLAARWLSGARAPTQVVGTTHLFPMLVHESLAEALAKNRLRGWGLVPVDLAGANARPLAGYSLLSVHGRCRPLGAAADGTPMIDPEGLDGADIFMPEGQDTVLIGAAAFAIFDALRERHLRFTPVLASQVAAA